MAETKNFFKPVTTGQDNPFIVGGTIETAAGQSLKKVYLTASITDISTAGQIYVVSPVAGTISKIYSVINGAIATANSILTPKIAGTAITGGAITVAFSGSAAGDVDSSTPTAANTITAGAAIEIETDGASSNTVEVVLTIEITLS
jgi:hypothetical protein